MDLQVSRSRLPARLRTASRTLFRPLPPCAKPWLGAGGWPPVAPQHRRGAAPRRSIYCDGGGGGGDVPYIPDWEPIAAATSRITAGGSNKNDAKRDLCRAIADQKIAVRLHLAPDPQRQFPAEVLVGPEVPALLSPSDIDWRTSRPRKPWSLVTWPANNLGLTRDPMRYARLEDRAINLIEVSVADVTRVHCAPATDAGPQYRSHGSQPSHDKSHDAQTGAMPRAGPKRSRRGLTPAQWIGIVSPIESFSLN
jgi:hypothetical protein